MSEVLLDRLPPQNLEAEQGVLGAILLENKVIGKASLNPTEFYKPAHQKIFTAMHELRQANEPIDLIALTEKLNNKNQLEEIGGASYLSTIVSLTPTSANIEYHAKIVKDKAHRRFLMQTAHQILSMVHDDDIDRIRQLIKLGIRETRGKTQIITARDLTKETIEHIESIIEKGSRITGLPSGFIDIDEHTSGFHEGEFIVLAARPGMGKTALADNMAINIAMNGDPVGIFSLEMSEKQSGVRHISNLGSIPNKSLRFGNMGKEYYRATINAAGRLANLPMYFCFEGSITVHQIWDHVEEMVEEFGVKMIFVDYLQLIQVSARKTSEREREVAEISRTFKHMAKAFHIPIMCLAQVNRSCETRQNKRPMLSDLRESGAIEQDSDVVMFIYRDEYYNSKSQDKGVAEIIFAKGRHFNVCTKELSWQEEMTRFRDLVRVWGEN